MSRPNACFRAAMTYLGRDWAALALCPPHHRGVPEYHRRTCGGAGKRPLGRWKAWQYRLPTVEEVGAQWEAVPHANVGIVLGPVSGLVGIDVDGEDGEELLREISRGNLPTTLSFTTGRGLRLLYALPAGVKAASHSYRHGGGEVKVLAEGTVTVAPPSRHHSGKKYRWLPRRGPGHVGPAPAPGWVVEPPRPRVQAIPVSVGEPIPEGQRNNRLFKLGCVLRRYGCTREEILRTVRLINRRCEPPLGDEELLSLAWSASRYPPGATG
jgi:hypothetical protein